MESEPNVSICEQARTLCSSCKKEPAHTNRTKCLWCLWRECEASRRYYARHKEQRKSYDQRRTEERRENGQCTKCGVELLEDEVGRAVCYDCYDRKNENRRR